MKPYQGILALIGYFVLWVMMYTYVSETHYTIYAGIVAVLVYGWLLYKKQMLYLSSRDLKGSQLLFCVGIGFGLALFSKTAILFDVLSPAPISEQTILDPISLIPSVATASILVPVEEELMFRGILFGSFARSFSYKTAILLSTVFFTLTHFTISWPTVFVIGILLAWIYWRTDNLAVTMVIHGTVNFFSLLSIPLYALLATNRTLGIMVGLLMVLLGIGITCLCTKKFLQKHDALTA